MRGEKGRIWEWIKNGEELLHPQMAKVLKLKLTLKSLVKDVVKAVVVNGSIEHRLFLRLLPGELH